MGNYFPAFQAISVIRPHGLPTEMAGRRIWQQSIATVSFRYSILIFLCAGWLISFQKVCHCDNFRHINVQDEKVFISGHKNINIFHDCRCKYWRIFRITNFGQITQIHRFGCINQIKRQFKEKTVNVVPFPPKISGQLQSAVPLSHSRTL